jgi:hypothetical protein
MRLRTDCLFGRFASRLCWRVKILFELRNDYCPGTGAGLETGVSELPAGDLYWQDATS